MAHWRSRVGEVEKERAEYKERLDKARGELDWRQRIHQQEQIRMRAIIEQTDAGRARAEANVKEMVSALRQGNGSVYSQAGVYSGDAESYTKASGHQNDHVDGDLNMPHQPYQKYQGNGMMPNGQVPVSDEWPRYGPYGNYAGNPANVVRNRPQYRNSFDDGMLDFRAMDPDKRRLPPVHPDPNKPMQRNSVGEQPHPPPGKKGMRGGRAEKIESKRAI